MIEQGGIVVNSLSFTSLEQEGSYHYTVLFLE